MGGGGERVTHWVVDCRPRLVKTVGNCKPTPPKHAHMCFLWWHSIQCDRHSENSAVRTIHKSETLINFLLGPLWLLLLAESLYVDGGVFISQEKTDITKAHHNQPIYPDFLLLCSQNPVQVSRVKTTNHTLYIYSRPLRCRHRGGRGGSTCDWFHYKWEPPIKTVACRS